MHKEVAKFLKRKNVRLTKAERGLLQVMFDTGQARNARSIPAREVKAALQRNGREISEWAFRQRIKRLNDTLVSSRAPFSFYSQGGNIVVLQNLIYDQQQQDKKLGAILERISDRATRLTIPTVAPLAVKVK
ncbi:MAG: hypothetical protein AAB573_05195 [Patescibacteria group bacterium]